MNRCFGESPSRLAYYVAEKRSWPRPYLLMQIHSPLLRPEIDQRVVVRGGNNEIEWDGPSKKQQSRKEVVVGYVMPLGFFRTFHCLFAHQLRGLAFICCRLSTAENECLFCQSSGEISVIVACLVACQQSSESGVKSRDGFLSGKKQTFEVLC